jgi:predicted DNA-binding transcriptional regulator AlpA
MVVEIKNYINIIENIDVILKNSPFKINYIIEKLGYKETTFFKKLKDKRFSPEELLRISEIIFPNEFRENEIREMIEEGLDDFENGRVQDFNFVLAEKRKKYAD